MADNDLRTLLLKPWTDGGEALFASQRELVRQIIAHEDSAYFKRERVLVTLLNQVFNGRRTCPDKLVEEIIKVALSALNAAVQDGEETVLTPAQLEIKLREIFAEANAPRDLVDLLLARQIQSKKVVVVNPNNLEARNHPQAGRFQEAMLRSILAGEADYRFIFNSNTRTPEIHWQATFTGLKKLLQATRKNENITDETVEEKIEQLETDGRLLVTSVAPHLCVIPLVAFDPHDFNLCDVYVWDWWQDAGRTINNIAKLSPLASRTWVNDYYWEIKKPEVGTRIRYKNVKHLLEF